MWNDKTPKWQLPVVIILCIFASLAFTWLIINYGNYESKTHDVVEGRVVETYRELRVGAEDWTTVIERPDGTRTSLPGKLGEEGEIIKVRTHRKE
jgi:hypothetical protein